MWLWWRRTRQCVVSVGDETVELVVGWDKCTGGILGFVLGGRKWARHI